MNNTVEYKVLKSNILKCCNSRNKIHFTVDYDKLKELSKEIGLFPVNYKMESRNVTASDIPFLNEYFIKQRLEWFEEDREIAVLTFFLKDKLDDEAIELIDSIGLSREEKPENDKVHSMAKLVANYPCYFATVISYKNLDPKRIGRPSYYIICRANKVAIKDQNYEYNPRDMA